MPLKLWEDRFSDTRGMVDVDIDKTWPSHPWISILYEKHYTREKVDIQLRSMISLREAKFKAFFFEETILTSSQIDYPPLSKYLPHIILIAVVQARHLKRVIICPHMHCWLESGVDNGNMTNIRWGSVWKKEAFGAVGFDQTLDLKLLQRILCLLIIVR